MSGGNYWRCKEDRSWRWLPVEEHRKKVSSPVPRALGDTSQLTLFVDGLPEDTTYAQVRKAFNGLGKLDGVYVQKTRRKHRRTKFGFVRFQEKREGLIALKKLNRAYLNGALIQVKEARFPL